MQPRKFNPVTDAKLNLLLVKELTGSLRMYDCEIDYVFNEGKIHTIIAKIYNAPHQVWMKMPDNILESLRQFDDDALKAAIGTTSKLYFRHTLIH